MGSDRLTLGPVPGWTAAVAGAVAIVAVYWDEAWHTDVGRDTFWSAPHLLLYGAVGVAGLAVVAWGVRALAATRSVLAVLGHGPLAVAGLGGLVVLGAGPADAAWHEAYGRDAVLWSPPHMLAVLGTVAMLLGLLTATAPTVRLRSAFGVLLLANALAVVFEYEAGVPQFSEALYVPVLLAVGVPAALLVRTWVPSRAPVTLVVLGYVALRLLVVLVLSLLGRSTPDLPVAVLGLAALDLPLRSTVRRVTAAVTATAALAWGASATGLASPAAADVAVTALPVIVVGAVILSAPRWRASIARAAPVVLLGVTVLAMVPAGPAQAHDPGQGRVVTEVGLDARSDGQGTLTLSVTGADHCGDLDPVRVVARRAGETRAGELRRTGACSFAGTLELPAHGRWFVYAELDHAGTAVETWLPVFADRRQRIEEVRSLYVPAGDGGGVTTSQVLAGGALYGAGIGVLVLSLRLVRPRCAAPRPRSCDAGRARRPASR